MYSRDLNCIFFHIPKTAGTSVERWLGLGDANPAEANYEKLFGWDRDGNFNLQHALPEKVLQLLGAEVFERCYRFTIVRNPFARSVSAYYYLFDRYKQRYGSFAGYLSALPELLRETTRITRGLEHHLPQIRYTRLDGVDCCHDIIRFEQLPESIIPVAQRLGLSRSLPFENVNRNPERGCRPISSFYTQETARLLVDIYAEDFATYGYSTDPEAADDFDQGLYKPLTTAAFSKPETRSASLSKPSDKPSFVPKKSSKKDPFLGFMDYSNPIRRHTVILFLTHLWNPAIALRFNRIREESLGIADCYLLLQDPGSGEISQVALQVDAQRIRDFDQSRLTKDLGYSFYHENGVIPGSTHFPVMWFARENGYDHYWVVEYDVEYTGNWGN